VPQCRNNIVRIAVTTSAGVGGITILLTGWLSYRFCVGMLMTGVRVPTAGAGVGFPTLDIVVTQRRYVVPGVAVATGTGVGGIANLGAGGSGNGFGVAVAASGLPEPEAADAEIELSNLCLLSG